MKKLTVNMLSIANTVKGQGVETAYNELTNLLDKYGKDDIKYVVNKGLGYDVMHILLILLVILSKDFLRVFL